MKNHGDASAFDTGRDPSGNSRFPLVQIKEAGPHIALVPHVVQPVDNDYEALSALCPQDEDRVILVSDKLSASQYKSIITKAKFCVAARTHVVIAAYSACIPSIAIGYSAKAMGIALDLGQEDHVVETGSIISGKELVEAFKVLIANEASIRKHLHEVIPDYSKNALNKQAVGGLI